ncbi:MAG: hypothetical protein AAFW46_05470 [Pseudomonadota bacterium]
MVFGRARAALAIAGCLALLGCGSSAEGPGPRACERLAKADLPSLLGGQIRPPEQRIDDATERRIYISTCSVRRLHGARSLSLFLREHRRPDLPIASEQIRRMTEGLSRDALSSAWLDIEGLGEAAAWEPNLRQLVFVDDEGRQAFILSIGPGGDPLVIARAAAEAVLN